MRGLLVLALLAGVWCAHEYFVSRQLDVHAAETRGVVEVNEDRSPNLLAEYLVSGVSYDSRTSRYAEEQAGDRIEIVYDATSPSRFQTGDFVEWQGQYFGAQLLLTATIAFTVWALALMGYGYRRA